MGSSLETLSSEVCEHERRRPACAAAQSDQRLCYSLFGKQQCKLAMSELSIFKLVSVAVETGLSLTL